MSVLIFLIPIALILSLLGLTAFIWTLKSKQYEDLDGASSRILFDENDLMQNQNEQNQNKDK